MRIAVGLMIIVGALAVSGVAQAANWQVAAGEQARPPAGTPKGTTLDAFFPSKLVISAGDSVTFSSATFHTVTYTGGKAPAAPLHPRPGQVHVLGAQRRSRHAVLLQRAPEAHLQPRRVRARRRQDHHRRSRGLERRALAGRAQGAAREGDLHLPQGGHVPADLQRPSRDEGHRDGEAVRGAGSPQPAPGDGQGPDRDVGGVGQGEAPGGGTGAGEHRLRGRREHDRDPRVLPARAEGQGGHDGQLRQPVAERGPQRRRSARRSTCSHSPRRPICSRPARAARTRSRRSTRSARSRRAATRTTARTTATGSCRRRSPRARHSCRCRARRR